MAGIYLACAYEPVDKKMGWSTNISGRPTSVDANGIPCNDIAFMPIDVFWTAIKNQSKDLLQRDPDWAMTAFLQSYTPTNLQFKYK